ncbi:MAG: aspartate aminotransferase family protein [Rhizobiaceae bacterium]
MKYALDIGIKNLTSSNALVRRSQRCEVNHLTRFAEPDQTIFWKEARGHIVRDEDDNVFLDFTSGFGACLLGHNDPSVVQAVIEQTGNLHHSMGELFPSAGRVILAESILSRLDLSDDFWGVSFAVSGSEAIDIALKACILRTGRHRFISFSRGFHGQSLGALNVTAHEALSGPFGKLTNNSRWFPYPESPEDLDALRENISESIRSDKNSGVEYAAIIFEPAMGTGGYLFPPSGFQLLLKEVSIEFGIPLIADEIFCGFGRSGVNARSINAGAEPDAICFGKAMANGFQIAACVMTKALSSSFRSDALVPLHGSTFSANPLGVSAAIATVREHIRQDIPARSKDTGSRLLNALTSALSRSGSVTDVRGDGLMCAVEIGHRDGVAFHKTSQVVRHLLCNGLVAIQTGLPYANVIGLAPPVTIGDREIQFAADAISHAVVSVESR